MKHSILSLAVPCALLLSATGAAGTDYIHRPVSVSFFPPLSTNGFDGSRVSTNFSLNIIGGYTGGLKGAELGSCFNVIRDDVVGFQASGALNFVGRDLVGVQAGTVNLVIGRVTQSQVGVVNFAGGSAATQIGVTNVAGGNTAVQAGVVSISAGNSLVQVGVVNITAGARVSSGGMTFTPGAANSVQVGTVNLTTGSTDAQVGVANVAGQVRKFQLGVVNVADESDVSIGLVSIVRRGQLHVDVWASDAALANIGIKTGSKYVYSVLGLGLMPAGDSTRLLGTYGLGGHIPLDRFFVDIDAVGHNVSDGSDLFHFAGLNMLSQLRVTGGWQLLPQLALTLGPAVSVFVSDREDGSRIPLYDAPIYHSRSGRTYVRIWPGFSAGVQLL
jgi:hypothetical protein